MKNWPAYAFPSSCDGAPSTAASHPAGPAAQIPYPNIALLPETLQGYRPDCRCSPEPQMQHLMEEFRAPTRDCCPGNSVVDPGNCSRNGGRSKAVTIRCLWPSGAGSGTWTSPAIRKCRIEAACVHQCLALGRANAGTDQLCSHQRAGSKSRNKRPHRESGRSFKIDPADRAVNR